MNRQQFLAKIKAEPREWTKDKFDGAVRTLVPGGKYRGYSMCPIAWAAYPTVGESVSNVNAIVGKYDKVVGLTPRERMIIAIAADNSMGEDHGDPEGPTWDIEATAFRPLLLEACGLSADGDTQ